MATVNLGRVQGGGIFVSTSKNTTSISKSTIQTTNGADISPLVGDVIINANGYLLLIKAVGSSSYTTQKFGELVTSKIANPLTVIVNGDSVVYDGSVGKTVTINTDSGTEITKEMNGQSSIQQITGKSGSFTGKITITNFTSTSDPNLSLIANPDGTEIYIITGETVSSNEGKTLSLTFEDGICTIAEYDNESFYLSYSAGTTTISQLYIRAWYSDSDPFTITYFIE